MSEHEGHGEVQQPIPFITDDGIIRRVVMVENGLSHLEAILPSMRRELAAIRQALEPRQAA